MILWIQANSIKDPNRSNSLWAGKQIVEALKQNDNDVLTLRLVDMYLPFVDEHTISAYARIRQGSFDFTQEEAERIFRINSLVDQFMAADVYLLTTPTHNFAVPAHLKAYIDAILVPGKTFRYNEAGMPEGLLTGKRAILVVSMGGYRHMLPVDCVVTYLEHVFRFIGIDDIHTICIEKTDIDPAQAREKMKQDVEALIATLTKQQKITV